VRDRRAAPYELLLLLPPLMPLLPPKPPLEPPIPLLPLELDDDTPALPRLPADVLPALRAAVPDDVLATELVLLPEDAIATAPAAAADLLVAALTRAVASDADLLVAATPPPVPDDWPETDVRAASSAVLREAACDEATVDGLVPLGDGGAE
jgi:hypothetical protein